MSIIQGNTKVSAAGYDIPQSIRFDGSAYLTRTPSSTGDQKKWTTSFWFKRCKTGTTDYLMTAGNTSINDGIAAIYINSSDDTIHTYFDTSGANPYGSVNPRVFRDPSAWYHLIWAVDAANTVQRIWVNGEELTLNSSMNPPNFAYDMNASGGTKRMGFGSQAWGFATYANIYAAEIHHLDGQYITDPTTFGEYNSTTGVWSPIEVTGLNYGTNGFKITGEDSADLGADYSGNGNDFTSSGLTTTDQVTDTPTDNYATWNPLAKAASATLSDGNLTITATADAYGAPSSIIIDENIPKVYCEFTQDTGYAGYPYFGLLNTTTRKFPLTNDVPGFDKGGVDQFDVSLAANSGYIYNNNVASSYISSLDFANGDVGMFAFDRATGKVWWGKNGTWGDVGSGTGDPAAGTNPSSTVVTDTDWFVGCSCFNGAKATVNFGQTGFTYTPPTGFSALSTANLPEPSIKDPSQHFNVVQYAGTGNVTRSVTGVGFQPDLVLAKHRSNASANVIANAVSGANTFMATEQTTAESSFTNSIYGYLSSFDSDGFTLTPGSTNNNYWNESGINIMSYNWLAGNGTSQNADGSITSTISLNQTAGFSIVQYTGIGATTSTVGHGLGQAPKVIICKSTSQASNWFVYPGLAQGYVSDPETDYLYLNTNAALADFPFWGDTAPTSSVFTINSSTNNSGDMIAYCWAEIPGFSRFTTFVGNGSVDGPYIHLGHRSRFFFIKKVSAADDWVVFDTVRDAYNLGGIVWRLESNVAEVDQRAPTQRGTDILSNGIKIRTSNATINGSGVTYIVGSWAEHPFKYANAR